MENRKRTRGYIEETLRSGFELLKERGGRELMRDIYKSKRGLESLQETYGGDRYFCCQLETYKEMIDRELCEDEGKNIVQRENKE